MRISTGYQYQSLTKQIQQSYSRWISAQQQVATGKAFQRPSDNPAAMQSLLPAQTLLSRIERLDKNLLAADDYLGNTENTLSEVGTMLQRARTLALNGANAATTKEARDGMATEVAEIQRRLVDLANSRGSNGQYIFAGQKTTTKPFTVNPPGLDYNGDQNPILIETRIGEQTQVNTQADTFFQGAYSDLENLKNDLLGANQSRLGDLDVQALADRHQESLVMRGNIGNKLQTVASLRENNSRLINETKKRISELSEVDFTEAVTQMTQAQTAYQAALQVTSRANQLSLMDFLR
ncbi:MAG: flagellar hook-associated protein FlgL [Fimbriimonadaceae bacterium]|nr:flagellar hook-associated protein FlgL [Fimbriimonadaceae bacterium]QYK55891.1 MAG: flagellar hook-associated protein FlgL [Fimbriimonadaceae bacterium]